jgi:8-oxo-dGTP pyrophosphatase MutT (NUDIX family)
MAAKRRPPADLPTSRAAGFVLTRDVGRREPEYLLLVNRRDGAPGLPKGHRDGDEDDLQTALRETEEETGLDEVVVDPWFRAEIAYRVRKGGEFRWKTVVYYRARLVSGEVRLSDEHTAFSWQPLVETLSRITFDSLRGVITDAALHAKDPALFRLVPPDVAAADRHLASLPHADRRLLAHLRGGARLARSFAEGLAAKRAPVDVQAAAVGTLLHDAGRALGRHEEHQIEGLRHLRGTPLAPYAFACVSHFAKGASIPDLDTAGRSRSTVEEFAREIDVTTMTWEERCAALADSCMKGPDAVPPAERFEDLRRRYDAPALIDLQERRTAAIREEIRAAAGQDPLRAVGLS